MQGLRSILLLICNKFNKLNNTGARMLDSFYQMTLKLLFATSLINSIKTGARILDSIFHVTLKLLNNPILA